VIPFPVQLPPAEPDRTRIFCPICVGNGYASAPREPKEWFLTANSVGGAIWNQSIPDWQLGLSYHQSTRAVRALVSFRAVRETESRPAVNLSYGVQSQETGATGGAATAEKSFGAWHVYAGASVQTDGRVRPVGGVRFSVDTAWSAGNQYDGRAHNPFVQYSFGDYSVGLLAIAGKRLSLTAGLTF
jgi:hypothetical protein